MSTYNRPRVYIAGPYSQGDPVKNTNQAIRMGTLLLREGFVPYVPHLNMLWHFLTPMPYETWIDYDNQWLPLCDAVLRLSGESPGADGEVALAKNLGIPVFFDLGALLRGGWPSLRQPNALGSVVALGTSRRARSDSDAPGPHEPQRPSAISP